MHRKKRKEKNKKKLGKKTSGTFSFSKISRGIRKTAKKVKKAGKIGVAAVRLGGRLANPFNQLKFGADAVRGKGFVLPGSKYIGPGNSLDRGKPTSSADAAALQHDIDYDNTIKKHGNKIKPKLYLGFSDADDRLMKRSDITTPDGLATWGGMAVKKAVYKLGLTGSKLKN